MDREEDEHRCGRFDSRLGLGSEAFRHGLPAARGFPERRWRDLSGEREWEWK